MVETTERTPDDGLRLAGPAGEIEALAISHAERLRTDHPRAAALLATLDPLEALLSGIRTQWSRDVAAAGAEGNAAEWFLDNFFVIERSFDEIREGTPRRFYRELPVLDGEPSVPRIYEVAKELLAAGDFHVSLEGVVGFLDRYQARSPLTLGEVWALPSMVRLVLLTELAKAIGSLAGALDNSSGWLALLSGRPDAPGPGTPSRSIGRADLVARAVTSLRALQALDWQPTAERISILHHTLARDPSGVYLRMDYDSRDRYRRAVEAIARRSRRPEAEVAEIAVDLASAARRGERPGADEADDERRGHVGYFLLDAGRVELERRVDARPPAGERLRRALAARPTLTYLGAIGAIVLLVVAAAARYAAPGGPWVVLLAAALAVVPAATAAVTLTNWAVTRVLHPRVLPKLDFAGGIPSDLSCLVVVPALVSSPADVDSLLGQLQRHHACNPDPALRFAVLSDFADAQQASMPEDAGLLARARRGIERLNAATPGAPFLFLHRRRVWNAAQGVWMGWERKRGKLHELNRLVLGHPETTFDLEPSDREQLVGTPYVLTLDADTVLPPGTVARLVGTLAHPLNRPCLDPRTGRVRAGYTMLQPRPEIEPGSAGRSRFTRIFAGDATVDLYSRAVSDAYHDLFGAGIYVGKGIYDVAAFERSLAGRVPENTLLSHDLVEGIHGRVGLVTDITLYEDYPPIYVVALLRTHRWIRGDWQLLRWLAPRTPRGDGVARNDLPLIDRWKIVDNLRRSLLAPATLALLVAAWLGLPGSPLVWTGLALLAPLGQVAAGAVAWLAGAVRELLAGGREGAGRASAAALRIVAARWGMFVVCLVTEAVVAIDAIARTLWRNWVSHRNLLQWTTAAAASRLEGAELTLGAVVRSSTTSLLTTALLGAAVAVLRPDGLAAAAPFLLLWLASPWIVVWLGRPVTPPRVGPLTRAQRRTFGALARRTWLFFEQYVGPEDNWLPPDNVQEQPIGAVAHRTSPTNIGLYLVSCLAAHDRGYLGTPSLVSRLTLAFDALDEVERYRGHVPNWLDTTTLQPLRPAYVSAVDSGNLAACLLVLARGCQQALAGQVSDVVLWRGLLDAVALLEEDVEAVGGNGTSALRDYLGDLAARIRAVADGSAAADPAGLLAEVHHRLPTLIAELAERPGHNDLDTLTTLRLHSSLIERQLQGLSRDADVFSPWAESVRQPPAWARAATGPLAQAWITWTAAASASATWQDLPDRCGTIAELTAVLVRALPGEEAGEAARDARAWASEQHAAALAAQGRAQDVQDGLAALAGRARALVDELDLGFLYNHARGLFHVGYNLDTGSLDGSYYDLLASEARLTSLLAIARHQVPHKHWLHLGRPMTRTAAGGQTLLSWSGTMFEYLLPNLLVENPPASLLARSCAAALAHQIAFGRSRKVPWGISESGFYAFDAHGHYQYRAFGVPGLALQRQSADDLVITPYASLLAAPLAPAAVEANLALLREQGAMGRHGLFEALDYTRARIPFGREVAVVRSHMAHHQGMILVALAQALDGPRMVQRFHAEPATATVSLLLREEPPLVAEDQLATMAEVLPVHAPPPAGAEPWVAPADPGRPDLHWLANGSLRLLLTDSGSGALHRGPVMLTRWRADSCLEEWGTWCYLQDLDDGELWSATRRPCGDLVTEPAVFHPGRVQYRALHRDIRTELSVTLAPHDDVELRRVEITNESDRPRTVALTAFAEVVLADAATDLRHPGFGKLFVEAAALPDDLSGVVFTRRPRSDAEPPAAVAFSLVRGPAEASDGTPATWGETRRSADRGLFLGRLRTAANPVALDADGWWTRPDPEVTRAPLDPAAALGQVVVLPPHGRARLGLAVCAADTGEAAIELARRYQSWAHFDHTFIAAASWADHELRDLGFRAADLGHAQRLLSRLVFPDPALAAAPVEVAAGSALETLWGMGISGDLPLVCVHVADEGDLPLVADLLRAHRYWRRRNIAVDVAFIDEKATRYADGLRQSLDRLVHRWGAELALGVRGGVFIINRDQVGDAGVAVLQRAAQAVFEAGDGGLGERLARLPERPARLPDFDAGPPPEDAAAPSEEPVEPGPDLLFDNGVGGFSPDGSEYRIRTGPGTVTPAPWANVVASPTAGFLCTESGLGATWVDNSGENRLTPWRNDPLTDLGAEAVYVRDEETGRVWSPTPQPAGAAVDYVTRHGAGYTEYEHSAHGLTQRLRVFVAADAAAKLTRLEVHNRGSRPRRLTVTCYVEWVLGAQREGTAHRLHTGFDADAQAITVTNPFSPDRPDAVAYLASDAPVHGWTADRFEFLGRPGSLSRPAALGRIGLARTAGTGYDPCGALQVHLDLPAGGTEVVTFLLGQEHGRDACVETLTRLRGTLEQAPERIRGDWLELLGAVRVETPDPALDLMVNHWLPYQTLAGRVWGRTGFYQSSGAYGFRDQLQDSLALLWLQPALTREHLLRAAAHQFTTGDVLHWWHEPSRGVRTRISDDLLWLPYATARYVEATGDSGVLDAQVAFLGGAPLADGEDERYDNWPSAEPADLLEHCRRAVEHGTTALGAHGLPLIGTGDWNDGMNRVGVRGRGESVWLAWFSHAALNDLATLCELRGAAEEADAHRARAARLLATLERHAWDGAWYRRAYDDDGRPLGSQLNDECRIDSIAQSWAVLSGAPVTERTRRAIGSAADQLVRWDERLVLLFTPPFDNSATDPGYIKGYLPGLRENGGQYTHAACWLAWASAQLGDGGLAVRLLDLINPVGHSTTAEAVARYRVEPYVLAADVYAGEHAGRGGWTWYTGSSAWFYRCVLEGVLGMRWRGDRLEVEPRIPDDWPGFSAVVRRGDIVRRVSVRRRPDGTLDVQQEAADEVAGSAGESAGDGQPPTT